MDSEQLAQELEGSTLPDVERRALITMYERSIRSIIVSGGDIGLMRRKMLEGNVTLSPTLFTFIWDEAEANVRRALGSAMAKISPQLRQTMDEVKAKAELDRWPFSIARATSIGDLLRLTLDIDGALKPMTMEIKDLYSQQRFREQFTVATGRVLDRIKAKAFDTFISGLNIEQLKDTGTSSREIVQDVLARLDARVLDSSTEEEKDESLRSRGYSRHEGHLFFRISKFKNESELRGFKPERLAQALEDIGAEKVSRGVWRYKKS